MSRLGGCELPSESTVQNTKTNAWSLCGWGDVEPKPGTNYQKRNPVYSTSSLT